MDLETQAMAPFVMDNETYCCQGCAEGTGCTCASEVTAGSNGGNRKGKIGQRNRANNVLDANQNEETDNSGQSIGEGKDKTKPRYASRGHKTADGADRPRSQQKERDSMRQPARGMSEFRGQLNNSRVQDRTSKTASKLSKPGEM